jgi:hypothetical protein
MTIQVTQITGDVVELVFSPWEEDLRVGEILSIVDRRRPRGLIVQILEIHSGPEPLLSRATSRLRRNSSPRAFSPRRRAPTPTSPPASAHADPHLAIAKIRQLTTPEWQAWDGWIPTRDAMVTRTPDEEVLRHCMRPVKHPIALGKMLAGERLTLEAGSLAGLNVIVGADDEDGFRLATVILRGLLAHGRPCVVLSTGRRCCALAELASPAQEGRSPPATAIVRVRAGEDWRIDLRQCGPAALLTLLTHCGLPRPWALYFVSQVAHRLANAVPAAEASQSPPFLGIEEVLRLAYDLEAAGDTVQLGAILGCLELIRQEGVLASTPAEATSSRRHYEAIRRGGGLLVDLSALSHAARGGVARAVFDMLAGRYAADKADGTPRSPCLVLDEPSLYLSQRELADLLERAWSLGMVSLLLTSHLMGIEPALLRRVDNLFLLRHGCPDDIRALANSGLLDRDTVAALSCRLGTGQGLLVGKATAHFPLLFAVEAVAGRAHSSPPLPTAGAAHERADGLATAAAVPDLPLPQAMPGSSEADATLPLFPEEALPRPAVTPAVGQEDVSPAPASALSLPQIAAQWHDITRRVGRRRRILETILSTARPVQLEGHTLLLGFPPQSRFQQELMATPEYRSLLEEELAQLYGVPVEVSTTLSPVPGEPRR